MKKFLDLLEQHCQWIAVGLGGLFVLLMLWSYLPGVSNPVTVDLGGTPRTPLEVESVIKSEGADPVVALMDAGGKLNLPVPQFTQAFIDTIGAKPTSPPLPATAMWYPPLGDSVIVKEGSDLTQSPDPGSGVAQLPVLPAPIVDFVSTGIALVEPVGGATPAASTPSKDAKAGRDVAYVRYNFKIPSALLDSAFRMAAIPDELNSTMFLAVELVRERLVAPDTYGEQVVVRPIGTVTLQPTPPIKDPAAAIAQKTFIAWAQQNTSIIVQPPFYNVIDGDNPLMQVLEPTTEETASVFDPLTFPINGDMSKLTPEQKAQVMAARKEAAKKRAEEKKNQGPQGGPRGPRGPGGRGGPSGGEGGPPGIRIQEPAGTTIERFAVPASRALGVVENWKQARPQQPSRPPSFPPNAFPPGEGPGGFFPPAGGMPGEFPVEGMPGVGSQQVQALNFPAAPQGRFSPAAVQGDIYGWAYDETAVPDQTYRYRVRYHILNPIFGAVNVTQNAELTQILTLVGEDPKTWSEPVTVPSLTHFFLEKQPSRDGATVRMTVFRWQNGKRHRATDSFAFGDTIGKLVGDVDYRTAWTLVGIRMDSTFDKPYALLMNPEGVLLRKDFNEDSASELQMKLAKEAETDAKPVGG